MAPAFVNVGCGLTIFQADVVNVYRESPSARRRRLTCSLAAMDRSDVLSMGDIAQETPLRGRTSIQSDRPQC
jgi:hypothetical protein